MDHGEMSSSLSRTRGFAFWALIAYLLSFFIPPGLMGFGFALEALGRCFRDPAHGDGGAWLLGASWLANLAAWAGVILLGAGARRGAAVAGECALVLAICALPFGLAMPGYWLWLASMAVIVWGAVRVEVPASPTIDAASRAKSIRVGLLVGAPLLFGGLLVALLISNPSLFGIEPEFDPNENVRTGEDARALILEWARGESRPGEPGGRIPESASDFWSYEGGNFGGSIIYWTFQCGDREDCLKAVERLGGLRPEELEPWGPSRYAVVMEGPDFYARPETTGKALLKHPWDVRGIEHGLKYERVQGDHRSMVYWAIDLDRNRLYYHYESGGFPADVYSPGGG